jgi:hypothetical protein
MLELIPHVIHAPYSTHVFPFVIFLFFKLKRNLEGQNFCEVGRNECIARDYLLAVPEMEYGWCFQHWQKR